MRCKRGCKSRFGALFRSINTFRLQHLCVGVTLMIRGLTRATDRRGCGAARTQVIFSFYLISSSSVVDADEFARFAVVWRKRCSETGPVRANQPCPRLALRQPIGRSNPSGLAAHSKTKSTFLIAVVSFTCFTLSVIYSRQLQRFRIARHRKRRVFIHLFIYLGGEPFFRICLSPNAILG